MRLKARVLVLASCTALLTLASCGAPPTRFQSQRQAIVDYVNEQRPRLNHNSLKGMEGLGLMDEQEKYYENRTDYFIDLVEGNEAGQAEFRQEQSDFYRSFPAPAQNYFYWSRDTFDLNLMRVLREKFGDLEMPADLLTEYYRGMVIVN